MLLGVGLSLALFGLLAWQVSAQNSASDSVRLSPEKESRSMADLANDAPASLASGAAMLTPPFVTTVSYTGPPVPIPDNTAVGVNINLPVSGVGTISDLNFRFDTGGACNATVGNTLAAMDHTFVGDLTFKLTSPGGTTLTFMARRGGTRENICLTNLDDEGGFPNVSTITSVTGMPISGDFSPETTGQLNGFDGQNANGTWVLNVSDNAGIDTGSMRRFSLIFNTGAPTPTPTPTPTATPTPACAPVTVSGQITTANPTQTNRLFRGGVASACGLPNPCGTPVAGVFHYQAHTFLNSSSAPACITTTLTTACISPNFIFAGAYLGSFDPANICTNNIGDSGLSPNGMPVSFSYIVPAGAMFVVVVSEVQANSGCAGYTLTIAGLPCTTFGNISTRLRVETGANVLIGGFIVTGTQPKKVIVRAIGPSLPLAGALVNPSLELRDSSGGLIVSNDNWRSDQEAAIIATGIPPSNDLESAIVATLPANSSAYSAIVRGVNNLTGIGVVEAYDLDRTVNSKLANISTRGLVQMGDNVLIGGLIVLGQNPLRVIVRAIGPSLPVPGKLGNPTLELRDGSGALIASNDNWRTDQEAEIIATTIPPTNDQESAIVRNLAPGSYTAIVRGVNNTTGIAAVEAYNLN